MKGLRLTLGGAPDTPHSIEGMPGLYRPGSPTPVGGDGQLPLEDAKRFAADAAFPVELVDIKKADEAAALAQVVADLEAARQAIPATMAMSPEGAEVSRVADQIDAVAPPAPDKEG